MNKENRKKALAQLTKQAELNKIADAALIKVSQVGDPKQQADQIFQYLIDNLDIEEVAKEVLEDDINKI